MFRFILLTIGFLIGLTGCNNHSDMKSERGNHYNCYDDVQLVDFSLIEDEMETFDPENPVNDEVEIMDSNDNEIETQPDLPESDEIEIVESFNEETPTIKSVEPRFDDIERVAEEDVEATREIGDLRSKCF